MTSTLVDWKIRDKSIFFLGGGGVEEREEEMFEYRSAYNLTFRNTIMLYVSSNDD